MIRYDIMLIYKLIYTPGHVYIYREWMAHRQHRKRARKNATLRQGIHITYTTAITITAITTSYTPYTYI